MEELGNQNTSVITCICRFDPVGGASDTKCNIWSNWGIFLKTISMNIFREV